MSDNVAKKLQNYHQTKNPLLFWKGAVLALKELFTELNKWLMKLISKCNNSIEYNLYQYQVNINEDSIVKLFEEEKTSISTYEKFDDGVNENDEEDESCEGEEYDEREDNDEDNNEDEEVVEKELNNLNELSLLANTLIEEPKSDSWKMITDKFLTNSTITPEQLGEFTNAIFLGNHQWMMVPITEFGIVEKEQLNGERILKSLDLNGSTEGRIINNIFDDVSTILNVQDSSIYFGIDALTSLMNKPNNYIEIKETTKKIFFPILQDFHYTLRVINLNEGGIYYYDSMIAGKTEDHLYPQILETVQRSANHCGIKIHAEFRSIIAQCPQQNNTQDCGIYNILNMFHPDAGENNGNLKYTYKDTFRDMIQECLMMYKRGDRIINELMKVEEHEK
jgi:hypothetical protein